MDFKFDKINKIKSPADIKKMSVGELEEIAQEMRDATLYRCSLVSGHVSPNLGDIESIIALHYVFDAPRDKIVFDVSHQDFAHKILTGRAEGFTTPEGMLKIGEYTDPVESPEYDLFYAGHTSPSVSLCVGLAKARMLKKDDYNIVAYIGDGALSGGQAFEGLNAAAECGANFIVIVNDNQMSIAENHGGLYDNLRELRETNGQSSNNFFRTLGYDYIYVHDGNNLEELISAFRQVRNHPAPVVVHINTQKGEGYEPAERDREKFHWSVPFDTATGEPKHDSGAPDYMQTVYDFIMEKAEKDPRFLVLSSATPGSFNLTPEVRKKLGKHYMDVAIAEQTGVSVLAGSARGGAKTFYPVIGSFLQRAYDQLQQDWAMDPSPALMAVAATGICGIPDITHLGFWDIPMITSIPDIVYLAPTNVEELRAMLEWGYSQNEHKIAVRIPSYGYEHAKTPVDSDYSDLNKFRMTHRGNKVAIIAAGDYYKRGEEVLALLDNNGIDATLINPRFVSGVDKDMIKELEADHELVVTIEDGSVEGGFGQRVASAVGPTRMRCLNFGLPKEFRDRYNFKELEEECGLTAPQITDSILSLI